MKKNLVALLSLLLLMLAFTTPDAKACTVTGSSGNGGTPLIGYVSKIVTHTTYWSVDFVTSAGTTTSNVDFGATSGASWSGSWDSHLTTTITRWSPVGTGGAGSAIWINGSPALTCSTCALVGSAFTLTGAWAGVTGIAQQSPADSTVFVYGWQGDSTGFPTYHHYLVSCPNSSAGGGGGGDLVDFAQVFASPEQSKLWWQQHA